MSLRPVWAMQRDMSQISYICSYIFDCIKNGEGFPTLFLKVNFLSFFLKFNFAISCMDAMYCDQSACPLPLIPLLIPIGPTPFQLVPLLLSCLFLFCAGLEHTATAVVGS